MKWLLKQGNIVDESVDVLICSANVSLDLSGGVGADLLGRYGVEIQKALHSTLQFRSPHSAMQGEIIPYESPELPHKAILHAVAVNGWYESSPATVRDLVRRCLSIAASKYQAATVALTALATGYGNLSLSEFAEGVRPLLSESFPPVEQVSIVLMEGYRLRELAAALPEASLMNVNL